MKKLLFIFLIMLMIPAVSADDFRQFTDADLDNATAFLDNLTAENVDIDLDDYPFITRITTWDVNKSRYENFMGIANAPIAFWTEDVGLGYWFYVVVLFTTLVYVYAKSKSLEVTVMMGILSSILVILPVMDEVLVMPTPILVIVYVLCGLGFGGILYYVFGSE